MDLTSRDRIMRLFRGDPVDRPSIKLWALGMGQALLHPDYLPVYELGLQVTDLFEGAGSPFNFYIGRDASRMESKRRKLNDEWDELTVCMHTDRGDLFEIQRVSRVGKPGYTMEHFVKDENDLQKILEIPYQPYPMDLNQYYQTDAKIGDNGITMFHLAHPAYAMHILMGSETLAFMRVESYELLAHAITVYSDRLIAHVKGALDAGLRSENRGLVFGWVGPELFIPPLMSPADFDAFCLAHDRRLIQLIHEAGGYAWVHCHGKVGKFIDRFVQMGADMLNPIEPPPMGDISLRDAFQLAKGRMALEGNIQIGDIMTESEEKIRFLVDRAFDEAGERFVLGLTTGYMEVPIPPKTMIDNLLTYLKYGYEKATAMAK